MKRSGFKRQIYEKPERQFNRIPEGTKVRYANYSDGAVRSIDKDPRRENPHLLAMALRPGQTCLLQIPGICVGAKNDTCACHGNSERYGKGLGQKAHDFFTVRGCARCHAWLDSSYRANGDERQEAFVTGLRRQISEWTYIFIHDCDPDDRRSVAWALQHLKERGYA